MADPKIRYDILANAEGGASVEALARDLEKLDNAFDPTVSARAEKLAADLRQLGEQDKVIQQFNQISKAAENAGFALVRADEAVHAFAAGLASTTNPTKAQAGELQKLNDAAVQARTNFTAQSEAALAATAGLDKLGISVTNVAQRERDVRTATNETRTAIAALATEAQRTAVAGEKLSAAWQTLGVRSFKDVQSEATKVRAALDQIQRTSRDPVEIKFATEAAQAKLKALSGEITNTVGGSVQGLVTKFGSLAASVAGIGFVAKPLFDLAVANDTLKRALTSVTGSAEAAGQQIEFLRTTAQQAGVSVGDISEAYVRFAASARSSGISAEVVNKVFASTANAAGNLGLSTQKVTLILDALGQMAGKGVVSMEELRQQLGDSLPGAVSLLAKGLGLTQAELIKLVESGQLLSRDALPALADAMTQLGAKGAQVEGLSASFNRLKNVIYEAGVGLVEGPIGAGAGVALTALAGVLRDVSVIAVGFNQALAVAGKTIALMAAAVTGNIGSFKEFKKEFGDIIDDAATKVTKFEEAAYGTGAATKQAGAAIAAAGQEVAKSGQAYTDAAAATASAGAAATQAAAATTAATEAHTAAAGGATASAQAHGALATAVTAAGVATTNTSVSFAKLSIDYTNITTELERQVKVSEKLSEAKKTEGAAAIALARISGDQFAILKAESGAAEANAKAVADLTRQRLLEVDVLTAQVAALKALSAQLGDPGGERAKQIAAIEKTLEARQAEARVTQEQAGLLRTESNERSIAVKAYGDTSAKLDELKQAYNEAANAAAVLRVAQQAGNATQEEVARGLEGAAAAQRLYSKAVADTVAATQRKNQLTAADNAITQASLGLDAARARSAEAFALAAGNEGAAVEARTRQRQIEVQAIEASVAAKTKEIDATIKAAQAERDAIKASDPQAQLQRDEIDLRIKNAQAAKIEAAARLEGVSAIRAEVAALQQRAVARDAGNAGGSTESRNAAVTAGITGRKADQDRINSVAADNSGADLLVEKVRSGGVTEADRSLVEGALSAARVNARFSQGNANVSLEGQREDLERLRLFTAALEKLNSPALAAGTTRTININMGGSTTAIRVASDADANALQGMLQQLADAKGRAA